MSLSLAMLEIGLETAVIMALVLAALFFVRRISAATQHGLLAAAVIAVLIVTAASPFVPARHLGLIPVDLVLAPSEPAATPRVVASPAVEPASETMGRSDAAGRATPAAPARWRLAAVLGGVWISGAVLVSLWVCGGLAYGWWLSRRTRRAESPRLRDRFGWALGQVGLRSGIPLLQSDRLRVPVVFGWMRPRVILPAHAESWPEDRLRAVLLHESAHIRRHDLVYQFLAKLVCAFFWFNPLAWIVERRLFLAGERAADDQVIRRNVSPADYAEHLMETSAELGVERTPIWATAAMAEGTSFKDRILSILDPNVRRGEPTMSDRTALTIAAVAVVFSLVGFSPWREVATVVKALTETASSMEDTPTPTAEPTTRPPDAQDDVATLVRMLQMEDASMREHAATTLGELGDARAVAPLVEVVRNDPAAGVREHAATALGRLGNAEGVAALLDVVLHDGDARVREHAATALGAVGDGRAREPLIQIVRSDPDPRVREHAVIALGRLGDRRAFATLLEVMRGSDVEGVRVHGAFALGLLGDPRALEPLVAALRDGNRRMRANAAQGLGELGDQRAVAALREARGDRDPEVRRFAREALERLGGRR